jgi:hypothetical protein
MAPMGIVRVFGKGCWKAAAMHCWTMSWLNIS